MLDELLVEVKVARLTFSASMSPDAFIADKEGNFDWAEPDREVHTFLNDREKQCGTNLFGRSMYEVMAAWHTDELLQGMPDYIQDYAWILLAADKIEFSRSLRNVTTARTRLQRGFVVEVLRPLKASAERHIAVGGANLAAQAFRAGLVDECLLLVAQISVGGGKRALPAGMEVRIELVGERRFDNGFVTSTSERQALRRRRSGVGDENDSAMPPFTPRMAELGSADEPGPPKTETHEESCGEGA